MRHGNDALANVMKSWTRVAGMFQFETVNLYGMGICVKCAGRLLVIEHHHPEGAATHHFRVFDAGRDEYLVNSAGREEFGTATSVVDFVLHKLLQARIDEARRVHPGVKYD